MTVFTSLRTRLTIILAGLFATTFSLLVGLVLLTVGDLVRREVKAELVAASAVFDRLWALKASQLSDGAKGLSRDPGFREAVGADDSPRVEAALRDLKSRLKQDRAFLVGMDGEITGAPDLSEAEAVAVRSVLGSGSGQGVLRLGAVPYLAVAHPVMAPERLGWLVLAGRLDRTEMQSLEALASRPLTATLLSQTDGGAWRTTDPGAGPDPRLVEFAEAARARRRFGVMATDQGEALALARPLAGMGEGTHAVLVLRHPLNPALAPYHGLGLVMALVALAGLGALMVVSGLLARSITRPVAALNLAAGRLRDGEEAHVEPASRDEIGSLAQSFNAMARGIRDREVRTAASARTDPETRLPNRRAFEWAIAGFDPEGLFVAVLGIDRFPEVRAAVGYPAAAEVLRELASRLGELVPDGICARLSEDRLVTTVRAGGPNEALLRVTSLLGGLGRPLRIQGLTLEVGLGAGLALVDDPHPASAVERASIALDQARASPAPVALFDPETYGDPGARLSLMNEMLGALEGGAMQLAYQPQYDLRAGRICGLEALIRWNHPVLGFVSPDLFLPLAEATGHIRALTSWTLERALSDQKDFRRAGHDLPVSVNLSGRMLEDPGFADRVIAMIQRANGRIRLEIGEAAVAGNLETGLQVLDRLRRAGIAISIDDYGSGRLSLASLKRIPGDELKIDKTLVMSLDHRGREVLLVKSIMDLAHGLGLTVVAVGVETAEALAVLGGLGCDAAQGYFMARPMPPSQLLDFLGQADDLADAPAEEGLKAAG
jgi:EAL domain-containing protein (putative c-di-GMP-specific phosphodiesterase class I)/GGDEF domain-containing protein